MSSLQIPAALAALAQQAPQGPQAPPGPLPDLGPAQPPPEEQQGGYDQLDCLKDAIDGFPRLLTELQDPRDVQDAVRALQLLAGIQTRLMQGASGPGAQG